MCIRDRGPPARTQAGCKMPRPGFRNLTPRKKARRQAGRAQNASGARLWETYCRAGRPAQASRSYHFIWKARAEGRPALANCFSYDPRGTPSMPTRARRTDARRVIPMQLSWTRPIALKKDRRATSYSDAAVVDVSLRAQEGRGRGGNSGWHVSRARDGGWPLARSVVARSCCATRRGRKGRARRCARSPSSCRR